ncbi:signal peptide peptidase SppA [Pelagibacterium sp. 26DY04]|uniref:signal peptide peptidase SppA n=1 Tax=Pelagibacterium sp. 26DY04 TaxID=2967130 RepID=UPI00281596C6|nr:signal peptide peptidase SppA [Pelagibacterium sp. 26DY04]WMT87272.1 signal peptide peptidase SppA [Pelagibacterium sp. 26DY04]
MAIVDDPVETIPVTRSLRRSRGRWRIFAFLALAAAVFFALARYLPALSVPGQAIARISISGPITTDPERSAMLSRLAEDDTISAVIVSINSPGGTTAGGEELYESLREIAEQKPLVSTIGELGASAAYMGAIASDHILARNLSIVGSVGVYYQHVDAGNLFDTIGIDLDKVASGALKSEPDFDEPITPEIRASLEDLVDSSFQYFIDLVAERRSMNSQQIQAIADGRILSGAMALEAGLIDETGGEREAIQWLAANHEIDPALPLIDVWPPPSGPNWLDLIVARALGDIGKGLPLDGLVALWHPHGP